eukprot:930205-Rhodomonas_salina.1
MVPSQSRGGRNAAFDTYVLSALPQQLRDSSSSFVTSPSIMMNISRQQEGKEKGGFRRPPTACERCRRNKSKCVEGRPCKRCSAKNADQPCLDCDLWADWQDSSQ